MPPRRFETLPFAQLVENIRARLKRQRASRGPAYTLLLGAGFSVPLVPTAGSMVKKDISWWLYRREHGDEGRFPDRPASHAELQAFEVDLWRELRERCDGAFDLDGDGLPDLATARGLGIAYQSIMSARCPRGLADPQARREYLRDVVDRVGNRINGAHLYLAGILGAQDEWNLGAPFCRTIFTTNFDPLLQRSLQLVQKLYYMTDRPEVLEAPADDEHAAVHLVYSHGSIHRYLLLNTEREIEAARETNATRLVPYFQSHGVIVMGYSGWRDATMAALRQCPSFSGNLYWCDIHGEDEAERRLGEDVLALLEEKRGTAFYVHIQGGADGAMFELHRGLGLGDAPTLLLDPLPQLVRTLESVNLLGIVREEGREREQLPLDPVEQVRLRTITRLQAAKRVFDEPELLVAGAAVPERASAEEAAGAALVARKMNDALVAARSGELDKAFSLWNEVIEDPQAPANEKVRALVNRGISYGQKGDTDRAIADNTAVIEMADAPAEQRAKALNNRGVRYGLKGDTDRAIADSTAVVEMADAPAEQRAMALYNRGVSYGLKGDTGREIADFTAVIEMADAPAEQRAKALGNRAWASYRKQPSDLQGFITDSEAALKIDPALLWARFNLALGLLLAGQQDGARAEYEKAAQQCASADDVRENGIADLEEALRERGATLGAEEILALLRARAEELERAA